MLFTNTMPHDEKLEEVKELLRQEYAKLTKPDVPYSQYVALINTPVYEPKRKQIETAVSKAADICIANKLDPTVYARAQYHYAVETQKALNPPVRQFGSNEYKAPEIVFYPGYLNPDNAIENYNTYVQLAQVETQINLEDQLYNQQLLLERTIRTTKRTVKNILLDHVMPFAAWFRVTVTKEPIPAVMQKYAEEAKLMMSPKLLDFLKQKNIDVDRILTYERK